MADWRSLLDTLHEEWRLRGRVPEGAFAEVDLACFTHKLQPRIEGPVALADFLRCRAGDPFLGPSLLGEGLTPRRGSVFPRWCCRAPAWSVRATAGLEE